MYDTVTTRALHQFPHRGTLFDDGNCAAAFWCQTGGNCADDADAKAADGSLPKDHTQQGKMTDVPETEREVERLATSTTTSGTMTLSPLPRGDAYRAYSMYSRQRPLSAQWRVCPRAVSRTSCPPNANTDIQYVHCRHSTGPGPHQSKKHNSLEPHA